jgi:hypothetical protein
MQPTAPQVTFLNDLRNGARRASAAMDASMVGPLIRANLVRWDEDAGAAARRRRPPGSTFTLTSLGAQLLEDREARCALAGQD